MILPHQETLRYLGYQNAVVPEQILQSMERMEQRLLRIATPKTVKCILPHEQIPWTGRTVCKAIATCEQVVLFAATLGIGVDREIARIGYQSMSDAVVMQAVATVLIEEVCNQLQQDVERETQRFAKPRISPGYGDFPIEAQRTIAKMLDTPRKIGLTLTDGLMLAPTKSVTALFGLTTQPKGHKEKDCELCSKKDCVFRKHSEKMQR